MNSAINALPTGTDDGLLSVSVYSRTSPGWINPPFKSDTLLTRLRTGASFAFLGPLNKSSPNGEKVTWPHSTPWGALDKSASFVFSNPAPSHRTLQTVGRH